MYDKADDVISAHKSFQKDTSFIKKKRRWEDDFNLMRQKPYSAGKGYYSYTSNAAVTLGNKVVSLLSTAKLIIRIPQEVLTADERAIASNMERFCYGMLNQNDADLMKLGMPNLREQISWFSSYRGTIVCVVRLFKGEDGKTRCSIIPWDIYNVSYGYGSDGIDWMTNFRKIDKFQAKADFGIDTENKTVDVYDYIDEENYGVIYNGEWSAKYPLTPHNLGYCPAYVIHAGSTPYVRQDNYEYTGAHVGESVFQSNRLLYPIINKTTSDLLTLVRRGVKVPLLHRSAKGDKTLDRDIYQVEQGAEIPISADEDIKPALPVTMPTDAFPLMSIVSEDEQRGGLPKTSYGQLGFRLSGLAINRLNEAIETVVLPFLNSMNRTYDLICSNLISQYAGSKLPPVDIRGRTSRNQVFGFPKPFKISPDKLNAEWLPEVRLVPVLPKDDAQKYLTAQIAKQYELMSNYSIKENILELEDPDNEQRLLDMEWADNIPLVKLQKVMAAAIADGDAQTAMFILSEIERVILEKAKERPPQEGQMTPIQQSAMGEGVGLPPGETGMPTSVMPQEEMGGFPPGAMDNGG